VDMRRLAAVGLAIVSLGAAPVAESSATQGTSLTVTVWDSSAASAQKTVWTLKCDPAGGSLIRPARACQRLASGSRELFAPLRKDMVCTQIYGGAQVALVTGMLDGRRLWARFQRRNGCEIARWNRLSPWLLPAGGVT
jgi:Subtilisin inhibitor-like